ncbi:MAG: AMP-binding protein [Bacteroidota bacterium]
MIVGGEDFKSQLAQNISDHFPKDLVIYNEYGPTEATVGCVVHRFSPEDTAHSSVPIGTPIANMQIYILDKTGNPVPKGVAGELYLAGKGLANGYWNQENLTNERFVLNPFQTDTKMYRTGDLARINRVGELEYLGRVDNQVKIGGIRVELTEIETALSSYPNIQNAVVELWDKPAPHQQQDLHYCTSCGLPSNYPNVKFDEKGVCNFCHSFEQFQQQAQQYFKNLDDLRSIFHEAQKRKTGDYDCMMLLSGGKDSTYALGQLVEMGYKVLAFTLDNGYISQQALDNVQRVADDLGVDCVVGSTPAMNEIFVDSLHRHCNVCNGCFKTIYTLSTQIALEKGIPIIVTGLSRGQFFETRLTEELFWNDEVDIAGIDQIILNARKEYHRVDDAVKRLLDTSAYKDDHVFEQVQYVDFYRYTDVSLQEMYAYLDKKLPWVRPTDTGRSTNCLINKLGIFVHTKEQGYSNYAFPYSWDVRMGHKQRDTAIDEINEPIDEPEVRQMMEEIGYVDQGVGKAGKQELIAFYVAPQPIEASKLRLHLAKHLPEYMIPTRFHRLDELPLTQNGKIDRKALPQFEELSTIERINEYIAPETQLEEMLAELWEEVLQIEKVGATDNFLTLGGNSLEAIRLTARISKIFELELPLNTIFEYPTIRELATKIEGIIEQLLADME